MLKTLDSGLQVQDQLYYETLDWIDGHKLQFSKFCDLHDIPFKRRSLNRFTEEEYELLLKYSE